MTYAAIIEPNVESVIYKEETNTIIVYFYSSVDYTFCGWDDDVAFKLEFNVFKERYDGSIWLGDL